MKWRNLRLRGFSFELGIVYGACLFTAIFSLAQDILGKELYIKLIQNYWVPAYIGIPVSVGVLIFLGFLYGKRREAIIS